MKFIWNAGAVAAAFALGATITAGVTLGSVASADSPNRQPAVQGRTTEPAFATVSGGKIMGARVDGVYAFEGVPYATATRFQEPQPVAWTDTKKALAYGEVCPNGATTVNVHEFVTRSAYDLVENENCLNLNVWSTSLQRSAKKPVVVWMHGGGFSNGSSAELPYYDGHNLAADEDVVFVSVNHRLNVLGYLDLSAYGDQYASTGNLGQLDLVSALKWVRENIGQFGGDPSNVTIVGQSGGAGKVITLMGMPSAKGLFQKAVALSGGSSGVSQVAARAKTAELFAALGITTVDELKNLPYATVKAAAGRVRFNASPVIDGKVYPSATITNGKFSDLSKGVPLMVSNTFAEVCGNSVPLTSWTTSANPLADVYRPTTSSARVDELLTQRFGAAKGAIVAEFQRVYPTHELFDLLFYMAGCGPNRLPTVDAKAAQGGAPVYAAIYAWNLPFFGGVTSVHTGGDLPFVLNNPDKIPQLIAGDERAAYRVADEASGALGRFAHTGKPSQKQLSWPAFTPDTQLTMVFDEKSKVVSGADRKLIDLVIAAR